jgi:hypothetical protein
MTIFAPCIEGAASIARPPNLSRAIAPSPSSARAPYPCDTARTRSGKREAHPAGAQDVDGKSRDGHGLPQAWVIRMERGLENSTVDQLEKLARALKVETAAFFAQPSRREASLDAGARSRK